MTDDEPRQRSRNARDEPHLDLRHLAVALRVQRRAQRERRAALTETCKIRRACAVDDLGVTRSIANHRVEAGGRWLLASSASALRRAHAPRLRRVGDVVGHLRPLRFHRGERRDQCARARRGYAASMRLGARELLERVASWRARRPAARSSRAARGAPGRATSQNASVDLALALLDARVELRERARRPSVRRGRGRRSSSLGRGRAFAFHSRHAAGHRLHVRVAHRRRGSRPRAPSGSRRRSRGRSRRRSRGSPSRCRAR